jgi:hypothetical protein
MSGAPAPAVRCSTVLRRKERRMANETREFRPRQRRPGNALQPGPLPEFLARMRERGEREIASPFRGVTTGGAVVPGLYAIKPTGHSLRSVTEAAQSFLAGLDPAQREAATFGLEDGAWRAWHNMHTFLTRHGALLEHMSGEQRDRALALLRTSMSAAGFKTACDVMRLNHHICEITERPGEFGEWFYWISILGNPSHEEPWGWQIDGHHLIVNCFVLGDQMVLTPNFMGSEPVEARFGKYAGTRVFAAEEAKGYALMAALGPELRQKATIGEKLPFDVFGTAYNDNIEMPYQGVRWDALSPEQRDGLLDLIGLYVGRVRPGHAEVRLDEVKRHLAETHFAWIGGFDPESPFYYRVHNPVILIEFDHQPGIALDNDEHTRNHIHTLVRTPNGNAYGKDLLRQHYQRFDHSRPETPHRRGLI